MHVTVACVSRACMKLPLLTVSWLLPLAGAVLLLFIRNADGRRDGLIRWLALVVSLAGVRRNLAIWAGSTPRPPSFQFVERVPWIPAFGIDYYLGVDGISLLLVVLTGFLTPIALLSSWESVERRSRNSRSSSSRSKRR